jgi:hypothetical protein
MPVPSSGQLRLRADINQEINGNDTDTNVSLGTLSNDAGFTEPDTMSEFYDYSSCGTPAFRTVYSSANPNGDIQLYTILDYLPACTTVEYGLYIGTNSSGPTANTKYQVGTSWGVYQWSYPTVGGFSNNTTYYAWIYVTNNAGKTGYSPMQTVTVPAPYVPVEGSNFSISGDNNIYTYANGCKNGIINSYSATHTNTSNVLVVYNWYQKYTTTYLNTVATGCRFDYTNQQINGSQTKTVTTGFEWNYNGAGGAFQTCNVCVVKADIPTTTNTIYVISKSGYTTRTYSHNLVNFIN